MNSKERKIAQFDPNGVGLNNGKFIGLPFGEADASIVLQPVPWDVTVSSGEGTATAAQNILSASPQLDLYDPHVPDAWKMGIYMRSTNQNCLARSVALREKAKDYINFLEAGGSLEKNSKMQAIVEEVNIACGQLRKWVFEETNALLQAGKLVGLIGGDHSTPLGFLDALATRYPDFGILQIDAHLDLRQAYEGFTYSHASVFHHALAIKNISKLVQVGIRDYCEEEVQCVAEQKERIAVFYDHAIKEALFQGTSFHEIAKKIIDQLPQQVYISFDIDGLDPKLCPNTGTPVPGGFDFQELIYLLKVLVDSGRQIIGFDLSEVAGIGHEWDATIGARIIYKLCNFMGASHNKHSEASV